MRKTIKMKNLAFLTSIVILFFLEGYSQNLSIATASYKAGQQRVLSTKMVKDYFMIANSVSVEEAYSNLDKNTAEFNQIYHDLWMNESNADVKNILLTINPLWNDFRLKTSRFPNATNGTELLNNLEKLDVACTNLGESVRPYSQLNGIDKMPYISSKHSMTIQKIALYCLAKKMIDDTVLSEANYQQAYKSFEIGLATIAKTTENSTEINQQLQQSKLDWEKIKVLLTQTSNPNQLQQICELANKISSNLDNTTLFYEKIVLMKNSESSNSNTFSVN